MGAVMQETGDNQQKNQQKVGSSFSFPFSQVCEKENLAMLIESSFFQEMLDEKMSKLIHGDHTCSFYDSMREQDAVLLSFVKTGLNRGERCLCVVDDRTVEIFIKQLHLMNIDAKKEQERGALIFVTKRQWRNPGAFDIPIMAEGVKKLVNESLSPSWKGLWIAVEMTWTLTPDIASDILGTWESFWNKLIEGMPAVLLCQYNRQRIPPAAVYYALKTHPLVATPDDIYQNFYYEPPDLFSNSLAHTERANWILEQFQRTRANEDERSQRLQEQAIRIQAEEGHRKLTAILESITDGFVALDSKWRFSYINGHAASVIERLQKNAKELIGKNFWNEFPDIRGTTFEEKFRWAMAQQTPIHFEVCYGQLRSWFEVRAYPSSEGISFYFQDITTRKKTEDELRQSLLEKDILLREIHHRVKNNLQVIASLLGLQSSNVEDPHIRSLFKESQDRVRSMALVHAKLNGSENLAEIDLGVYIDDLANDLLSSYGLSREKISFNITVRGVLLPLERAISCAMILHELISNSIKYAFPGDKKGKIQVSLFEERPGMAVLSISDDGIGLPKGFEVTKAKSLGLRLVTLLAKQLHGAMTIVRKDGVAFHLTFPCNS
jgi:two-component sensor histidine kinase